MTDADANPKPVDGTGQNGAKNAPTTDDRDMDDPLPPEEIEPASGLTPEEAEQARKRYLLKRFWISARGYWSRRGVGWRGRSRSGCWR